MFWPKRILLVRLLKLNDFGARKVTYVPMESIPRK